MHRRVRPFEALGLDPLGLRLREALLAVRGDSTVPPTKFGVSSLGIFHPALSVSTWLGRKRADRRIPISNLFNHTPTPSEAGWSVRKTQVRDFRGGTLSYDSHNGTDFAIPVGTVVTAAAPGRVGRISSEYNRGGLKIFIDHGQGLVTTSNHLARSLVNVGDRVARAQPIALSGYSGLDALVAFPWSVPHVHFNVWLNGVYVDPFARLEAAASGEREVSLWRDPNDPRPSAEEAATDGDMTAWDEARVEAALAACRDDAFRASLSSAPSVAERAMNALFARCYYPTRFTSFPPLYAELFPRTPRLTLPFRAEDFDGVMFT